MEGYAGGSAGLASRAPTFTEGNSLKAGQFAIQAEEYLASMLRRSTDRQGSVVLTMLTAAAPCFPRGSQAALWFESCRGLAQGMHMGGGMHQPVPETIWQLYLYELTLYLLNRLDPDNPPAPAEVPEISQDYCRRVARVLPLLWDQDLRAETTNIHHLLHQSHHAFFTANPNEAPVDPSLGRGDDGARPRYTPAAAADRAEYSAAYFNPDYKRKQFLPPDMERVEVLQAAATVAMRRLRGTIGRTWAHTRSFFSEGAVAARLNQPPMGPVHYFFAIFRAQWVRVTPVEQEMLRKRVPRKGESYTQWKAEWQLLVSICAPEPPFTPTELAKRFMEVLLIHYGEAMYNYVADIWTGLPRDDRHVELLYDGADCFYDDYKPPLLTASTATRSRSEQSPARGRTPYPHASPGRSSRLVTFDANTHALYDQHPHHHRHQSPEPHHHHRHSSPEYHSYYTAPSPSSTTAFKPCLICKMVHKNGVCFYNTNPKNVPDTWHPAPEPTERLYHYIELCRANGWSPRWPANSNDPSPPRTVAIPAKMSAATASRPRSTYAATTTTPRPAARAPYYQQQPPPERLQRQQEREERHAAHHADAEELEPGADDGPFFAAVLDAGVGGWEGEQKGEQKGVGEDVLEEETGDAAGEGASINVTTRSEVLKLQRAAATAPAVALGQPAWTAPQEAGGGDDRATGEGGDQLRGERSVIPEPHLKRKPMPVGFTAEQLPSGMLPAQLQARETAHLAVVQQPAVQRMQALSLASGVVPVGARMSKGGAGLVSVPLQQLLNFGGLGEYVTEPMPLVVSGVGAEQYAMGLGQVSVLMGAAQAVQIFGGVREGPQANYSELLGEQGTVGWIGVAAECGEGGSGEAEGPTVAAGDAGELGGLESGRGSSTITTTPLTERRFEPPSVTYVEASTPEEGISLTVGDSDEVLCCLRALIDSGANINGISLRLAMKLGLKFCTKQRMALRGASKLPSSTLGRVTTEVDVVFCHNTTHRLYLRLPLHVIDTGENQSWDLLLGTGFLAMIGAKLDFLHSTLSYTPQLIDVPNTDASTIANLSYHTIPITTVNANPTAAFMRDLVGPAAGVGG